MLVIDTSSSMTGAKIQAAVSAARTFLALVDPRRDRVGLATFDNEARRDYVLTQDLAAVSRQLDLISLGQGTRIDLGLEIAMDELRLRGRERTPRLILLLTDGRPDGGSEQRTLELARQARAELLQVVTIGLGEDVDAGFLRQVARVPEAYHFSPDEAGLRAIFGLIAGQLPCR
jgi:Mg-chelatase subunit ChlD